VKRNDRDDLDKASERPRVSKGNVFDDLGFSPRETAVLKTKTELLDGILEEIRRKKYTQKDLTELLSEYQPQVSNLLRGKISKFSVAKLLSYAQALGLRLILGLQPVGSDRVFRATKRTSRRIA
jgi:predicted XRE-type DNA-binding protein